MAEGEHTQLVLGHCNKTLDLYLLFRFGEVAGGWILLVDILQWIKKSSVVRDDMAMRLSQIYAYSCRVCSLKRVRSVCPNWISDLCKKSAMPEQTGRARHSLTAGISSSTYLYLFLSLSVDFLFSLISSYLSAFCCLWSRVLAHVVEFDEHLEDGALLGMDQEIIDPLLYATDVAH